MVCCVLIALLFALPFIVARQLTGWLTGTVRCNMAWRPVAAGELPAVTYVAPQFRLPAVGFSIGNRAKSFIHAGRGLYLLLRYEHSAWIQLSFVVTVVAVSLWLDISANDWRWMVLLMGLVLCAEGLNTAIENACNAISVEYCSSIKAAKDVAAGTVLLISLVAALIGAQILLPYVLDGAHKAPFDVEPDCHHAPLKPPHRGDNLS